MATSDHGKFDLVEVPNVLCLPRMVVLRLAFARTSSVTKLIQLFEIIFVHNFSVQAD